MSTHEPGLREEVKKEFQLERMILFSDAVFAIVITLMAIEIKLPDGARLGVNMSRTDALEHLLPAIVSYAVSFFVIGAIWYRHLGLFSVLKDYDRGLVVRNLALLFFIGLFPFSVSLSTHSHNSTFAYAIYMGIIFCCVVAQYLLQRHLLVRWDRLCTGDIAVHRERAHRTAVIMISYGLSITLIFVTRHFTTDHALRSNAVWWIVLVPLSVRIFARKKTRPATA